MHRRGQGLFLLLTLVKQRDETSAGYFLFCKAVYFDFKFPKNQIILKGVYEKEMDGCEEDSLY
ncbi:hypothetical protein CON64_00405 [Bacillus pseudomycoides]|nr:hypothetical protein CON64_00405 [Bacillus pseudomycoides]